jgi:hypothetical protein
MNFDDQLTSSQKIFDNFAYENMAKIVSINVFFFFQQCCFVVMYKLQWTFFMPSF